MKLDYFNHLWGPDTCQIDGLGGADSLTSKLALRSRSKEPGRDIDNTFGAVGIDKPFVGYSANCGNIGSVVCPCGIDQKRHWQRSISRGDDEAPERKFILIYVFGKKYEVTGGLMIRGFWISIHSVLRLPKRHFCIMCDACATKARRPTRRFLCSKSMAGVFPPCQRAPLSKNFRY